MIAMFHIFEIFIALWFPASSVDAESECPAAEEPSYAAGMSRQ